MFFCGRHKKQQIENFTYRKSLTKNKIQVQKNSNDKCTAVTIQQAEKKDFEMLEILF